MVVPSVRAPLATAPLFPPVSDAQGPRPAATRPINSLRGVGFIAPTGQARVTLLENALGREARALPDLFRGTGSIFLERTARLAEVIERLAGRALAAAAMVQGRQGHTGIGRARMGQTDIRGLLIVGASRGGRASSATSVIRWVVRKGGGPNSWLAAVVARKPEMVAASALANKMAFMIRAVATNQKDRRMA